MDVLHAGPAELVPLAFAHAADLRGIITEPEVARWWGEVGERFPFDTDEDDTVRRAVLVEGVVVGLVDVWWEDEPAYRHAGIDLSFTATWQGRGLGRAVVGEALRHLHEDRGYHRVTIDPCAENERAVRCYRAVGFRDVGRLERAWRGPDGVWRDTLLMEHVEAP